MFETMFYIMATVFAGAMTCVIAIAAFCAVLFLLHAADKIAKGDL